MIPAIMLPSHKRSYHHHPNAPLPHQTLAQAPILSHLSTLHPIKKEATCVKTITSSLGEYKIYPNFMMTKFNEAIDLGLDHAEEIISLMHENMEGDFGWIADNINSYSINPFLYSIVSEQVKTIQCYCNVIYHQAIRDTTEIGRYHFPSNIALKKYNSIQEAIIWTNSIIDSK